jgi:hypothetical protein
MVHANDELSFRVGRFYPVFGLMPAEHQLAIRSRLGWDQGQESYNLEGAWIGEKFSFFGAAVLGKQLDESDHAGVFTGEYFFKDRFKVGASIQVGERFLAGPHLNLGITPHLFYLAEVDFQKQSGVTGVAQYQKLSWEIFQGFHLFGVQEFSRSNFLSSSTVTTQYGPGIQWFPRPHFEFQLSWEWVQVPAIPALDSNLGLAMINFYL